MGKIFKGALSILGVGSKTPKVSDAAPKEVKQDLATSKTARASLYATSGAVSGEELNPDQVKKRGSLLGN